MAAAVILAVTWLQMVIGVTVGFEAFNGKGFIGRIIIYPILMLALPAWWWWRQRGADEPMPWGAFCLIMTPFLIDVTGNTLDLYDTIEVWDDLNHFVNWFLLLWGVGLLLFTSPESVRRPFVTVLTVAGTGALLAVLWEVGEWFVFLRGGVEVDRLYQDTLGDEILSSAGALLSGLLVLWWRRRAASTTQAPARGDPQMVPGESPSEFA